MRKIIIFLISIMLLGIISVPINAEEVSTNEYTIQIDIQETNMVVTETFNLESNESGYFTWLNFTAYGQNIIITMNGNEVECESGGPNQYSCNVADLQLDKDTSVVVEIIYELDKSVETFTKKFLNPVNSLSISFDENTLFNSNDLKSDSLIKLKLYQPIEPSLPIMYIAAIIILLILLILFGAASFRSKSPKKTKKIRAESEELLSTKKSLLMSLLKDLEKQHRAKKITDDTYSKLKDQYKGETVDAMKKLEDMDSKVK